MALQLFRNMQQRGVQPAVITYFSVISACKKGRDVDMASQLFRDLQHRGIQLV